MLASIGEWILSFILKKIYSWVVDHVSAFIARKQQDKKDEDALNKHEQIIKNPGATDAEIGQSFEDTLNS